MDAFFDWMGYWVVRTAAFFVQRMPPEAALAMGAGLGRILYFASRRRPIAYANLKAAFPESSPEDRKRWIQELARHLGMSAMEMLRFPILTREEVADTIVREGLESYLKLRQERRGLILLTAHLGNWELSQIAEGIEGRPLMVLARKQKHRRLDELLGSFRQTFGSVAVSKGAGIRDLIRALRQGGTVGVLGDQSGGERGVWVRFFGRLTTAPRGPMALALKLGVPIIPVFTYRQKGPSHRLVFDPTPFELVRTGDYEKDVEANAQRFFERLESEISNYPSQWLWGHKRWKRRRTLRVLLLSDKKPGHLRQVGTFLRELRAVGEAQAPPYEFFTETIEVEFRSLWQKRIFPWFAFFFIPFAQGRLAWLRRFFTSETSERIERAGADLVVSAGAGLAPVNLCLARENLAKSAVVMKPSFPFDLFRYDLAVIPAHDRGLLPRGHLRVQGSFSYLDSETLKESREKLLPSLAHPERIRLSLFLGGETRDFKLPLAEVENLLTEIERASEALGGDYLVTTSRRTPEAVNQLLSQRLKTNSRCQLCVIATHDGRPEVVPGMMALADFLVVTEDSVSMISEGLSSGKTVVIVKMARNGLPKKHIRFQEILKREWGVPVVEINELSRALKEITPGSPQKFFDQDRHRIRERLAGLLS